MSKNRIPMYRQIQHYISSNIESGKWLAGTQIPTEKELVERFKVSRMTVTRAVRELADRGSLERVQGGGTFVLDSKAQSNLLEIHDIADEIKNRGHRHSSVVHYLGEGTADNEVAALMELEIGAPVFQSTITHFEKEWPVQLEDKYVNPEIAPEYLVQDFTQFTPNSYLMQCGPLDRIEHIVESVSPNRRIQQLLKISESEPCLLLQRRTWSDKKIASISWLYHPGSRYRLGAITFSNK